MRKAGLIAAAIFLGIVLLASTGHMIGLAASAVLLYFAWKGFVKTDSTGMKIFWAAAGLIALSASAANLPAIIGIAALYGLLKVVKRLKGTSKKEHRSTDPFDNFERQWNEINQTK
ncbi:flagellar basal body rod protein [Bacillus mangrovi]|uniref:Flagellar basal body rod protein n=1 Tax=Metabacillus mangrovi TaxID=1491830 RepID=A0A7X2V257_9BACI|nr:flagellar basal body rod protein [Metabacillus mangrovi]MTH51852.1 flagellar basal body rod protein [Metabacillus mangrovi]